jgi:hypothetical protein
MRYQAAGVLILTLIAHNYSLAQDQPLTGYWKLSGNAKDAASTRLDLTNQGVTFAKMGPDGKTPVAVFDGRSSYLDLKSTTSLQLGIKDFTLSCWVHTEAALDDDLGDLITMYDSKKRVGFNLSLRNNTGVTSCQANVRQLQFGIDAGSTPKWTDEGRPGNAILGFSLAAHEGQLFVGTATNDKKETGRVYRYQGPNQWIDCGAPDKSNAISAMAVYRGKLYVASSKYRFAGSALTESENQNLGGGIFRYEGENRWVEMGRLPETEAIGGLVVFKDQLYASSLYKPAGFFRFDADGKWTALPLPDGKRVESMGIHNGYLWATSYDAGKVFRFDGNTWKDFGQLGENTQTYSFAVHRGRLCVGTWPSGKVFQLNGERWEDLGRLGNELEVMGMLVHNGQLYGGTLPMAEVYRFDGNQSWTKTAQLDLTPNVKYRRAWTMAQFQGRLFCSTLPSGHIYSMVAGPTITHDHELTAGWHHIAAQKQGGLLNLYVDGKKVAESTPFDPTQFDLTTAAPFQIGAGAGDFFRGSLAEIRFDRRALPENEIANLVNRWR